MVGRIDRAPRACTVIPAARAKFRIVEILGEEDNLLGAACARKPSQDHGREQIKTWGSIHGSRSFQHHGCRLGFREPPSLHPHSLLDAEILRRGRWAGGAVYRTNAVRRTNIPGRADGEVVII